MDTIKLSEIVASLDKSYVQIQTNSGPWFGIVNRMFVSSEEDAFLEVITEGKEWRIPAKSIIGINKISEI